MGFGALCTGDNPDVCARRAQSHCLSTRLSRPPAPPARSDEIYALSVFKPHAKFTSAITLAQQLVRAPAAPAPAENGGAAAEGGANGAAAPPAAAEAADGAAHAVQDGRSGWYSQRLVDTYVHMLYGLSKDWCGSGLRVGLLYSRNRRLQQVRRRLRGAACSACSCVCSLHPACAAPPIDSPLSAFACPNVPLQSIDCVAAFAGVSNHTQWALAQVRPLFGARAPQQARRAPQFFHLSAAHRAPCLIAPAPDCRCLMTRSGRPRLCSRTRRCWRSRTMRWQVRRQAAAGGRRDCHGQWIAALAVPNTLAPPLTLAPAGALKAEGIPFVPAVAGMFVWVDLRCVGFGSVIMQR